MVEFYQRPFMNGQQRRRRFAKVEKSLAMEQ